MTEALVIVGYIVFKIGWFVCGKRWRRVSVSICENGHRCFSCEPAFEAGRKIDVQREILLEEEFYSKCYHPCSLCPPVICEHDCPECARTGSQQTKT